MKKPLSEKGRLLKKAESLKIDIDKDIKAPQKAWELKNLESSVHSTLGTLGNFSLIIGKAKSRKSFFVSIAISAAISEDIVLKRYKSELPKKQQEVIYFDTEQGEFHVQQALKRICRQTGIEKPDNLHVYHLRTLKPSERLKIIETIIYNNDNVGFVVIDGIRDLVTSINDEVQATKMSSKLLKWSEERNIHIVTVLHQNKSDNNARGHLGTELVNKAETVLSVIKMKGNEEVSIVEPVSCRNKEPESFAFKIIDGLPTIVESFTAKISGKLRKKKLGEQSIDVKYELLRDVFTEEDVAFSYGRLIKQIKSSYDKLHNAPIGDNQVKDFITECRTNKWLLQKQKKGKYTLGLSLEDDP